MSSNLSHLRRLYHHMLNGGSITPDDLSMVIARLEGVQDGVGDVSAPITLGNATPPKGRVGALRDTPMWDMTEAELRAHRSFTTKWSEEDGEFVGLCDQFPSLSCLDADEGKALAGIMGLVARMESENE